LGLHSLAAALLLKTPIPKLFFKVRHFYQGVSCELIITYSVRGGFIAGSPSNKQSQGYEKLKIHWQRGTPRKAPTGQNLQQLDEVPWSLEGRSRKAKKVASSGTTTSWEN
jgi:hypothetical protein